MTAALAIPALILALIGWLVPRGLSLWFPEGVRPLLLLAFIATLIMFALGTLLFVALYWWQGFPFAELTQFGWGNAVLHFGRLGLISGLFWGPLLVLSVAGLPKGWVEETW